LLNGGFFTDNIVILQGKWNWPPMVKKKHIEKLPNAPLQEVVFELFWELESDSNGLPVDNDYEYALGLFKSEISKDFKHSVKLTHVLPKEINLQLFSFPRHQFWAAEKTWPVVQLGPGILVVNDIEKNYTWQSFRKQVLSSKIFLENSYNRPLTYVGLRLKYIDAFETGESSVYEFMNQNFNISLNNNFGISGSPVSVNIAQRFNLDNGCFADFNINSALNANARQIILWHSAYSVESKLESGSIESWLDNAHDFLSRQFKEFVKPEFYARFTQQ
jgi:uncharacterized protein (TIGR04255 family)